VRIDRPREDARLDPDVPDPRDAPKTGDIPEDRRRTPEVSEAPDIPDRVAYFTEYREKVDVTYRAHAIDQGCDRVRAVEETVVTPAMRRIESADPDRFLVGLEHSLKGRDRLSEKVQAHLLANPEISYSDAFAKIKDAIRYTFQYSDEKYASGVLADAVRLREAGFKCVDSRNAWSGEQYKGLNSWWRVPDSGQLFEVQFHTRASFEAKQETHDAYEKLRNPATSERELDGLEQYQRRVTARVPVPPGATDIPDKLGA
jgi:hypothetical protein